MDVQETVKLATADIYSSNKSISEIIDNIKLLHLSMLALKQSEDCIPKRLYSIKEAAQYMGVGITRFGENYKKYVIPIKNGSHYLIPKEELDAWVEQAKRKGKLFY